MTKKTASIIAFLSFIIALLFNEYNLQCIKKTNPQNNEYNTQSLMYDVTIFCVDNEYYLSPVTNFMDGKGWKRSPAVSNGDYFRRVPGYSIIYYVFVKVFGYPLGHQLLTYFQLFLFALAVYCFCFIVFAITQHHLISIVLSLVFGFAPTFTGWLFYTMTESLTPILMVFYVYYLLIAHQQTNEKRKLLFYLMASFFIGFNILTRPYTAIAGLMLVASLWNDYYLQSATKNLLFVFKKAVLIGIIPVAMVSVWTVRNYVLTGEFVPLERAYHPQTLDRMKPEFEGMLNFAKCWGEDGPVFNSYHQPLYYRAMVNDTSAIYVKRVLATWPKNIVNEFGYQRLYNIVHQHQQTIFHQKVYYDKQVAMPDDYLPEQIQLQSEYNALINEYKSKHLFHYWVTTPLIYLKRMIVHSNTSHIAFFQKGKENGLINMLRYFLVVLHVAIYCSVFFNLFFTKNSINKIVFVYTPLLFIFFFTVFHREIEQRYMMPILPVMMAGLGIAVKRVLGFKLLK